MSIPALVSAWYIAGALMIFGVHADFTARRRSSNFAAGSLRSSPTSLRIAGKSWDRDVHAVPPPGAFQRLYRVRATAYVPRAAEGGRYTFTERDGRAVHGIAVDPHVIPLGTRVWIPGYGSAIADDVGSAIQGHRIDLRVQEEQQMAQWGARDVRVYVLQQPD